MGQVTISIQTFFTAISLTLCLFVFLTGWFLERAIKRGVRIALLELRINDAWEEAQGRKREENAEDVDAICAILKPEPKGGE